MFDCQLTAGTTAAGLHFLRLGWISRIRVLAPMGEGCADCGRSWSLENSSVENAALCVSFALERDGRCD